MGTRPKRTTLEGGAPGKPEVPNDLWTVEEVAAYFKVGVRTIKDWRDADPTFPMPLDLPGRSVRWYAKDVVDWALSLRGELV